MVVLQDTKNGKASSMADLQAQLDALKAENAKLKDARNARISLKVSAKGAVSLYGLGRFPLTLYSGQWDRVLSMADQIRTFMDQNKDKLAVKE
jgi:hypothetical protein